MFRHLALRLQSIFNDFDPKSAGEARHFSHPGLFPVFIIGAPRSGSTLLYQLLVKHTRVGYISNLMSLFPNKMITLARYTKARHGSGSLKTSHLGYITGLFSPSEAGAIQRKWFEGDLKIEDRKKIRNTLILLSKYFNGPFVCKNLMNSLRLNKIHQILPEARYIFIKRNPLYNAQSILLSRLKVNGSERFWWSVKPEGYAEVEKLDPKYQVVWQVLEIEKLIHNFFTDCDADCIQIAYEELCRAPGLRIQQIAEKFDLDLCTNIHFDPISVKNEIRISSTEWSQLQGYYDELRG